MDNVTQEQYPGLAGLDFARRWMDGFTAVFENLLVSLSSILLTIGIGVSMFDFFTGGSALENGYLMNGWATIQTLAVDTQFIVMWYRCKLAIKNRNYIAAIGYGLLGSALGFVVFATNAIPSLQLATHQDFNSAITTLGFDAASIVWIRSAVLVVLAIIAAFNRTVITFSHDGTKTDVLEPVKIKKEKVKKEKIVKVKKEKIKREWMPSFAWFKRKDKAVITDPNQANEEQDNDVYAIPQNIVIPEDKTPELNEVITASKSRITRPLNTGNTDPLIEIINTDNPEFRRYPIISGWLATGRKTATIDELIEASNQSKRSIQKRLKDGTLKTSSRNADLIRLDTVLTWLEKV